MEKKNWKTVLMGTMFGIAFCAVLTLGAMEVYAQNVRPQPRRADGYCSITGGNQCSEVGTTCQDTGTAENPKSCDGSDPTSIDYCNCL